MGKKITKAMLEEYKAYLYEQEKSKATIQKYMCDIKKLVDFVDDKEMSKSLAIQYKEYLKDNEGYKTSSVNSFLVAANRFFEFMGWYEFRVKTFKLQKEVFMPQSNELSKGEYKQLVETAFGNGKIRIEMISNSIKEMRTYGEGFVIIDQSPMAVDVAAIENTATKIIMNTPARDACEELGSALSLSEIQTRERKKVH